MFTFINKRSGIGWILTAPRSICVNVIAMFKRKPESPAVVCFMYTRYAARPAEKAAPNISIRTETQLLDD
jgi:hypothetical protein